VQKMWENAAQRKLWRDDADVVGRSGSATIVAWHARLLVVRSKSSLKAFVKHNAEEVTNAQEKRQLAMGQAATPFRNAKMRLRTDDQVPRQPLSLLSCPAFIVVDVVGITTTFWSQAIIDLCLVNARNSGAHADALRGGRQEDDALWDSLCSVCGSDGDVLCCEGKVLGGQGCSNVAHLACCGLSRTPRGSWFCADCRNRRELEGGTGTPAQLPNPSPTPRMFKVKF